MLRLRYEEKLERKLEALSADDAPTKYVPCTPCFCVIKCNPRRFVSLPPRSQYVKNQTEYLFWIWDPELIGGCNEPIRILEEGFLDAESSLVS